MDASSHESGETLVFGSKALMKQGSIEVQSVNLNARNVKKRKRKERLSKRV
jgi:hypothetical protein